MRRPCCDISGRQIVKGCLAVFLSVTCALLMKLLVVDCCRINGYSMSPTLSHGEYVIVAKCAYGIRLPRNVYEVPWVGNFASLFVSDNKIDSVLQRQAKYSSICQSRPKRGDIVAFHMPGSRNIGAVKRVVGLPGDSISMLYGGECFHDSILRVVPFKGMKIDPKSLNPRQRRYLTGHPFFVFNPADSLFTATDDFFYLRGDNADGSIDSRSWGPVAGNLIIGKIINFQKYNCHLKSSSNSLFLNFVLVFWCFCFWCFCFWCFFCFFVN